MIKLSKVSDEKLREDNNNKLVAYLEDNIDSTVAFTLRLLGHKLSDDGETDHQSSLEQLGTVTDVFESDKLNTRC